VPEGGGTQADDFAALEGQNLKQKLPGQALASVAVGTGRVRNQVARKLFVNPVGAPGPSVTQSRVQAVVAIKALKEQIPNGDQWVKEAIVEALRFESRQLAQGLEGQESDKEEQELGGSENRRWWCAFWVKDVFLDGG
jgi:hypothetical protein